MDPEGWCEVVYADRPVVVRFDRIRSRPVCVTPKPSDLVAMLSVLDAEKGESVVEVGTGCGFTAALLAELVERGGVHTVDADEAVLEIARGNLRQSGRCCLMPRLADGEFGHPDVDVVDRVLVSGGIRAARLPYALVERTRSGGRIVAPVCTGLVSGPVVSFTVHDNGTATGRAQPVAVDLAPLRSHGPSQVRRRVRAGGDDPRVRMTDTDAIEVMTDPASRWTIAITLPSIHCEIADGTTVWLHDPVSGSWANISQDDMHCTARQCGPRNLWDEVEAAHGWWVGRGRPCPQDWVWTVTPDGQSFQLAGYE